MKRAMLAKWVQRLASLSRPLRLGRRWLSPLIALVAAFALVVSTDAVDGVSDRERYLYFDLFDVKGIVLSARFRFYVENGTPDGLSIVVVNGPGTADPAAPDAGSAADGQVVARLDEVPSDTWYEVDVTEIVRCKDQVTLALERHRGDVGTAALGHDFQSPLLILEVQPSAPATGDGTGETATGAPGERRPYTDDSPWNLPIGPNPTYDPDSDAYVATMKGVFGADPTQYTLPVYEVDGRTPKKRITVTGLVSLVNDGGRTLTVREGVTLQLPIPDGARPADGTDAQMILWNLENGDEWGFWDARKQPDGSYVATNGYHYNTHWRGVPPDGFVSRGAGIPYLAGLVRPWEIERRRIEHAIAFGYDYPTPEHVCPATKSDGINTFPSLPEGARLQLDPTLTEEDFDRWGLSPIGKVIAGALQEYGMILVDRSDHPKIYVEYEGTARWNGEITDSTVARIPLSAFRVLDLHRRGGSR